MKKTNLLTVVLGQWLLAVHVGHAAAMYEPPPGGWTYIYTGDAASGVPPPGGAALDGTWNNNNDSDEWDLSGRGPGNGAPGGVESNNGILTLEDAANSTSGTANNRKLYFSHDMARDGVFNNAVLDDGVTISLRARLTPPDGKSQIPMPNGYGIYSDGKGMFGVRQSGTVGVTTAGIISFSLTSVTDDGPNDTPAYNVGQPGLVMNRRNGDAPSANVDTAEAGTLNLLPLDPTQWHEFWITIQANNATPGNGTHLVRIYTNGSMNSVDFNVTAGLGNVINATNYIALGLNNSPSLGAFDIDFFAYNPGVVRPSPRPANDDFANRIVLSGTSIITNGNNAEATKEGLEPQHSPLPHQGGPGQTVWWSWTAPTSNAVKISVTGTNGFSPILSVYIGNTLDSIFRVVGNYSGVDECRVVFSARAGVTYQIAVDSDIGMPFTLGVQVIPPPANDHFANRAVIQGSQLDVTASFVGASRQTGEPTHGEEGYPQTLWWTWRAPAGTLAQRVSIHADAVSHAPDVAVYTGIGFRLAAISGASNVTDGMTRVLNFLAVPGTTYQIAVAGRQSNPDASAASDLFGEFHFRFNASSLAMVVDSRSETINGFPNPPAFQTTLWTSRLRIENWGNARSRPVRVRLQAIPGVSLLSSPPPLPSSSNLFVSSSVMAPSAQSVSLMATGLCPAPITSDLGGIGWAVYAFLEEQLGTNWLLQDYQFVGFGVWPDAGGFSGPGGGVTRIDPQIASGTLCIPILEDVAINGPGVVVEGSTVNLSATAFFNCPSNHTFTSTVWTNSHPRSSVSTNGVLRVGSVTNNTAFSVTCFFEYRGVMSNATRQLLISNLPAPFIASRRRHVGGAFQLGGSGVPDRRHSIQASTNLCCPGNWVTLKPMNVIAIGGMWSFIDTNAPAYPRRFYRVLESE